MIRTHRLFPIEGILLFILLVGAASASGEEQATPPPSPVIQAFQAGEVLTYNVSWSNVISAGTAVMEVKEELLSDGSKALRFVAKDRSAGAVDAFYRVNDSYESVFDPRGMRALSFHLLEIHKKKERRREVNFDYENHTVVSRLNEDPPVTAPIPDQVQDALSSIYYLRTREDLAAGKPLSMNVFDSGKIWSVDVTVLGREKVSTPAGEFKTIKVMTNPRHEGQEGVFKSKGGMSLWLTDDARKVPVLIKSSLSFGSLVMTLKEAKTGNGKR